MSWKIEWYLSRSLSFDWRIKLIQRVPIVYNQKCMLGYIKRPSCQPYFFYLVLKCSINQNINPCKIWINSKVVFWVHREPKVYTQCPMICCIIAIEQLLENIDFIYNNGCYGYYSTFEHLIWLFVPLTVQIIVARQILQMGKWYFINSCLMYYILWLGMLLPFNHSRHVFGR